jgi:glycosyltransferase involved in cell wall biosynthesis
VIIPTHNRLKTLPGALQSVLNQTFQDLEILIVDDGSTDGTQDWLRALQDPRVFYICLEASHGAGAARNQGLRYVQNEWVAFQDSDDTWVPDKLEKQLAMADLHPEYGVIYCRCSRSSTDRTYVFPPLHAANHSGSIFDVLLGGNLISTQTALVKKECFERYGRFDESLPPLEDWEFFLRVSRDVSMGMVDEILVDAPFSEDSISKQDAMWIRSFQALLEMYSDDYKARPHVLAKHTGTIADRLCMAGRWNEGRQHFAKAFRMNPKRIGNLLGWLLASCPSAYKPVRDLRCGEF